MASKVKKSRPKRPAIRLGEVNTTALVDQLRELHKAAGPPEFERFPASDELVLVLKHAERVAGKLAVDTSKVDPKDVIGQAAVIRAKLWQYLHEQADAGQLKAIETGRAAGVAWDVFREALCVGTGHGAQQKAQRLKAEQVRRPDEPRTPQTARDHEEKELAEQHEQRDRIAADLPRFTRAQGICRQLFEHRDGLVVGGMSAYWLNDIAEQIDRRETDLEKANLVRFLGSFVHAIHQLARDHNPALAQATEFVHARPVIPRQASDSQTGSRIRGTRRRRTRRRRSLP
ncbi:hypothetical protein ABZW18_33380 [Streptomyces sp. NPDC004647]|uniref:hypothetical protein n=1 Tax=Streptomyces sp. NPDC004647 TaxID=3154671 RepID=UPI0033B0389D